MRYLTVMAGSFAGGAAWTVVTAALYYWAHSVPVLQ